MIKLILIFSMMIIGCSNLSTQNSSDYIYKNKYHYGILNKTLIKNHDGYSWFNKNYNNYEPNIDKINIDKLNKTSIKIFMGTWCHDSKREVPRFYKILDALKFDQTNLQIIGLTKDKKGLFQNYSEYKITSTPTFIFFDNDKEIGRIIEKPQGSLEMHIKLILDQK